MATYAPAVKRTIVHELGYATVAGDKGGETLDGIARNLHPQWSGWPIVDKLKPNTNEHIAKAMRDSHQNLINDFYKTEFWDKMSLDTMTNQMLAEQLFDIAVNHGCSRAGQFIQGLIGTAIDGKIGPGTISVVNSIKDPKQINNRLVERRSQFYWSIWTNNESQIKFMRGWQTRALAYIVV